MPIIVEEDEGQNLKIIKQAKMAFIYYFYEFFAFFDLPYTHRQLIEFTRVSDLDANLLLMNILNQYCSDEEGPDPTDLGIKIEGGTGM